MRFNDLDSTRPKYAPLYFIWQNCESWSCLRFHVDGEYIYIRNGLVNKNYCIDTKLKILYVVRTPTLWMKSKWHDKSKESLWDNPEHIREVTWAKNVDWNMKFINRMTPYILAEALFLGDI